MNKRSIIERSFKKMVKKALVADANRASCAIVYQPKAPAKLDTFKKTNK